jgi:uncharacterized protein YjbJ (UPF0337 family)
MESRHKDDSLTEEASALGQRVKGATKGAVGSATGNERLEREGDIENAEGRARQATNNVFDETDGVRGATVDDGEFVTGYYRSPERARETYDRLTTDYGCPADEVVVLMSDETRKRYFADHVVGRDSKALEGLGAGSAIGGGIGAALGAVLAIGTTVLIPGLNVVVAGPLAAALAGAGAGGATGGVLGALIGAGIPEVQARDYEKAIDDGGIVLGVRAKDPQHAATLVREFNEDERATF